MNGSQEESAMDPIRDFDQLVEELSREKIDAPVWISIYCDGRDGFEEERSNREVLRLWTFSDTVTLRDLIGRIEGKISESSRDESVENSNDLATSLVRGLFSIPRNEMDVSLALWSSGKGLSGDRNLIVGIGNRTVTFDLSVNDRNGLRTAKRKLPWTPGMGVSEEEISSPGM